MKIQIEPHTAQRAKERGVSETEIMDTLQSGDNIPINGKRLAKAKVYPFNEIRNGKFYSEKKVEVYYVVEAETTITVTVYAFFGNFNR